MKTTAVILAAGKGMRMKSAIPKQFLLMKNKPVLLHSLEKFAHFNEIILVLPESQIDYWKSLCSKYNSKILHTIVNGGDSRFYSVKNGLEKVDDNSLVAIHDGVRPLVTKKLIDLLISEAKPGTGSIPVIPLKDSIRKFKNGNSLAVDRNDLWKVQTPQCFISSEIKKSYMQKFSKRFTDDASVFESSGGKIRAVIGNETNLKITTKYDLKFAQSL